MKTFKDYYNIAFDTWYYNTPKGYLIFVSKVEPTGAAMAWIAAEMILEGRF